MNYITNMNKTTLEDVVRAIREFHSEHGRVPLKLELERVIKKWYIDKYGGLDALVRMAGFEPMSISAINKVKITNEVFKRDIAMVIDEHIPTEFTSPKTLKKILVAPDSHFPFAHKPTVEEFYNFNREQQPDIIVQVGDLYDMYAHSRFPRSHNLYTPKEEERLAREHAEAFFKQLRTDNPQAIIYNIKGNHDIRPLKRVLESLPQFEHWAESYLNELMTFEGVNLVSDHREILKIDNIGFHHGYLGQLGAHRDSYLMNMVVGHTHKGGVTYRRIKNEVIWELNAGLLGDYQSKVMDYTATKEENQTLGFGFIDKYGPRFIHK